MPTPRAVRDTIAKARANPDWRGENKPGPGRNRIITPDLEAKMVKLVFTMRGSVLVSEVSSAQTNPSMDDSTRPASRRFAVASAARSAMAFGRSVQEQSSLCPLDSQV